MLDLKITNGFIVDGTGKAGYPGDVGVKDGKIAALGDLSKEEALKTIDAMGNIVSPGWIDMHSHADMSILYDKLCSSRIYSGVTTDVIGNCGIGVAPLGASEEKKELLLKYLSTRIVGTIPAPLEFHWESYAEYLDYIDEHTPAINIAPLLSQGAIRIAEMGFSKEDATEEQIAHMQAAVAKAMQEGALGLTTGLMYLPGAYTGTRELTELCKATQPYGGIYVTHIRDYMDNLFPSVEEAIKIAKDAGVPLQLSHFMIMTSKNTGKFQEICDLIEAAKKEGVDITYDTMPYDAGMTSLSACLPPWSLEGGVEPFLERIKDPEIRARIIKDTLEGTHNWSSTFAAAKDWNKVTICSVQTEANRWVEGMTLKAIAEKLDMDEFDVIFKLLEEEKAKVQCMVVMKDYEEVVKFVCLPDMMIGSDSMSMSEVGLLSKGKPHARAFGTFGKYFREFVREKKLISLEQAVHKITQIPAKRLGFTDRGVLQDGANADITVFDINTITDNATYADPKHYTTGITHVIVNLNLLSNILIPFLVNYTTGITHVIVNGQVALENGKQTGVCAGKTWRNPLTCKD